jgi:hypothetical protein
MSRLEGSPGNRRPVATDPLASHATAGLRTALPCKLQSARSRNCPKSMDNVGRALTVGDEHCAQQWDRTQCCLSSLQHVLEVVPWK